MSRPSPNKSNSMMGCFCFWVFNGIVFSMIIDGKKIAAEIMSRVEADVAKLETKPLVAAVLVGAQEEMRRFLEIKEEMAKKAGFEYKWYEFPADITTKKLRAEIVKIAKQKKVSGIILELPLPKHINQQAVLNAIPQEKDPDVLSQKAQGAFFVGRSDVLPPCPAAVKAILDYHEINVVGKRVAVFGYGLLVGRPAAHMLAEMKASVTVIARNDPNQAELCRQADIIVTGIGNPGMIKADMVKDGAIVMDFGYGKLNGKISGDVDFESVKDKASLITPVPGGVGPLVCAVALENVIKLL